MTVINLYSRQGHCSYREGGTVTGVDWLLRELVFCNNTSIISYVQVWTQMQAVLRNGLSSRCIVGESGPWQLVVDAMATDAKLVPLFVPTHGGARR